MTKMQKCPNCGSTVPVQDCFCEECGEQIVDDFELEKRLAVARKEALKWEIEEGFAEHITPYSLEAAARIRLGERFSKACRNARLYVKNHRSDIDNEIELWKMTIKDAALENISTKVEYSHEDKKPIIKLETYNVHIGDKIGTQVKDSVVQRSNIGAGAKTCPNCGREVEANEKFCNECGARL